MDVPSTDNPSARPPGRWKGSGEAISELLAVVRQWSGALTFFPVFVGSYYFSYWLRFEGELKPADLRLFWSTVTLVVVVKLVVFSWLRTHQQWKRFVTFYDLLALIRAATSSLLLIVLADRFLLPGSRIPRSVYLLDWGTTIVVLGGFRALLRFIHESSWRLRLTSDKICTFIVGADDAGEALLRAIIRNGKLTYRVVGFIDEDPRRVGIRVCGVPVVGTVDQTCRLAKRYGVREVLIAAGGLSGKEVRKLVDEARRHAVSVKVLPSYEQLITGKMAIQPRPVSIDDLLRRAPVRLDVGQNCRWVAGRVLMVTGSAGSIGSEICRQLLKFSPKRLVLVDRTENGQFFLERELRPLAAGAELEVCIADVLDRRRMRAIFNQHRPEILFHAAAYKHVPLMEANPGEAVKNIVLATRRVADLAAACRVESFVLVSTDKAVNPTSVMGACKRVAELYVQSLADASSCRFVTVRFGNVLDSEGSVVQIFRRQIAAGGPVTVTDRRMQRYFMTIPEAASLVVQAGAVGRSGEILVLDMGNPVRIVDLAVDLIRLSGLEVGEDIDIEVVGLRPGEKLFEELRADGEDCLPTPHPKIVVAGQNARNHQDVAQSIDRLGELADDPPGAILRQLGQIVAEYLAPPPREKPDRRAA